MEAMEKTDLERLADTCQQLLPSKTEHRDAVPGAIELLVHGEPQVYTLHVNGAQVADLNEWDT